MPVDDTPENEAGHPYWWIEAARPDSEPPVLPERTDVLVIGSGYTGLCAALALAKAGREVVVLDKRRAGEGASSRNGGICSGNLKPSFGALTKRFGRERALAIFQEGIAARKFVGERIREEGIDCDYTMTGRFTGVTHPNHLERIKREVEMLNREFDIPAWFVEKQNVSEELGTDLFHGGYVREDIGGLHPGKYQLGLLEAAIRAGARFHGGVTVKSLERDGEKHVVTTSAGVVVADHVIAATNGYSDSYFPFLQRRVVPIPSQIVATAPISPNLMKQLMPKGRMCGTTDRLFNYYRPSPNGKRILFGGRVYKDSPDPMVRGAKLKNRLIDMFPELSETPIERSWFGYTGFTMDFLPKIGVHDGVHYACGYNGSGVIWASYFGHRIAQQVMGDPAGKTAFDGIPFQAIPFFSGNPWFLGTMVRLYGIGDAIGR